MNAIYHSAFYWYYENLKQYVDVSKASGGFSREMGKFSKNLNKLKTEKNIE